VPRPDREEEISSRRGRLQFSLKELLVVVTVASVLLAIGRWCGWAVLYFPAFLASAFLPPLLPFAVVWCRWSKVGKQNIGPWTIVSGACLILHVALTGLPVEWQRRNSFYLDLHPFYHFLESALNWTVPAVVVGLLIAFASMERPWQRPSLWVGAVLIALGVAACVWYGDYFYGELMGDSLAEWVWWL
jgi:hypothetical protein